MKYDAVVVGAGVAGLNAAYVLASKGFKVAIVESKPREKIGDKTCGDAIGTHHFEELGWKPPEGTIDHYYRGVKIYSPSEKYAIIVPGEGVSVNRVKFGQWLLKRAENAGATLLDKHVVLGVKASREKVDALIVKKIGTPGTLELEAEAFIDASGAKPAIRSRLPEEWPIAERPYQTDYNIAYREVIRLDKKIEGEDRDYAVIYLNTKIAPGGYWWLFPKDPTGETVNVGLGVIWGVDDYNPRRNYNRYLKPRFPGKLVHAGGGMVPTRRPLPTMVWRNVGAVGDAAYTVNPVHGGGIGSSMQAATIVAGKIAEALEKGRVTEEETWMANKEYLRVYGAKQASLDILRMYLQKLSNEDFEWIIKNKIVDGEKLYELGTRGSLVETVVKGVTRIVKLMGRPSLLNQLRIVKKYMDEAVKIYYDEYPEKPEDLKDWMKRVDEFFGKYRATIGFNPGSRVKW
jgi:digeranylgeranylglycerophospholipid reductase